MKSEEYKVSFPKIISDAKTKQSSSVDHPNHYGGDTTYEVIKVIEAWGLGFHVGNVVKYVARAGKKNPEKELEDLNKALWYLKRYIESMEKTK